MTVADHQPPTVLVNLVGERLDVAGDLGLQRRSKHLSGTIAHDLVEQRPTGHGFVGRLRVVDYLEHGRTFPNRRANADPDQNVHGLQILLGKVRPFTSPGREPSTGSDHCSDDGLGEQCVAHH